MKVTNNSKAPQGVHTATGVVFVGPGESREAELSESGHKLASRLDFLKVSGTAPKADEGDKEALFAKLKALGVEAGKNSSLKTLQERLVEAESKAKEEAIAKLKEKGVDVGDDVTLEELQAELAKHP
ncbi:hypothetical protein OO256_25550 [Pseudomonas sp. DCB_CB]|uniref:hypothetical protein n=1 Tax=unclassified Pseudomonas TaxID=196821 RepID=UPI0022496F82|nr:MULTISPECIES: hypothetical protein [unclassified Pseudomonas]MCX2694317.1 hypothetical protein [Pseudomonas sp. DCB_BZ]MCX2859448.1 hypothetical protein [Pseudomonas sp. DCB_CB]